MFVLGMPRSGTSLVEQILASHARVFGAGEVKDLVAATTADFAERKASAYPELYRQTVGRRFEGAWQDLCGARSAKRGAAKDRIVDKMPSNFLFVGLIHLALPNARIIHVKRNPVDTCVSCFSLLFAEDQPFAYDLGETRSLLQGLRSVDGSLAFRSAAGAYSRSAV